MSIFQIVKLKKCQLEQHERCSNNSKKCECYCHDETKNESRDIHKLRKVKIVPKTYCPKCNYDFDVELDFCKICNRHLIQQPNYHRGKKVKFAHCMGDLDYLQWEVYWNKRKQKQKELDMLIDEYWERKLHDSWDTRIHIKEKTWKFWKK